MGLSGRKVKQRIPDDPRNLSWADNAARFGSNYLSKFGWDASKGLGAEGDGRTSHIKVSHKLDMLGIGAAHQKDPNGIAWKQNKDYENLLRRLNQSTVPEGSAAAGEAAKKEDVAEDNEDDSDEREKKKRKRNKDGEDEREEYKEKSKKKRKSNKEDDTADVVQAVVVTEVAQVEAAVVEPAKPKAVIVPRHRAHRARAIAAKSIASKSASAIAEILGIAPSSSSTPISGSETPQGKLTSLGDSHDLEKLTISSKTVTDYFKEKLLAKKAGTSGSSTPTVASPSMDVDDEDAYEAPRGGLGSSRLRMEIQQETIETETQRMGMSKFSSLMSSSFLAATTSYSTIMDNVPSVEPSVELESSSEEEGVKVKKVKEKQEEKQDKRDKKEKKEKVKKDRKGKKRASEEDEDVLKAAEKKDAESVEAAKKSKREKRRKEKEATGDNVKEIENRRKSGKAEKKARKEKKKKDQASDQE